MSHDQERLAGAADELELVRATDAQLASGRSAASIYLRSVGERP